MKKNEQMSKSVTMGTGRVVIWTSFPKKKSQCICSSSRKNVSEMFRSPQKMSVSFDLQKWKFFFLAVSGARVRTDRYAVGALPRRREHLTDIFSGGGEKPILTDIFFFWLGGGDNFSLTFWSGGVSNHNFGSAWKSETVTSVKNVKMKKWTNDKMCKWMHKFKNVHMNNVHKWKKEQ